MTKHLLRPSLFQARDSVSPSSASPVSHLRSHSRSHAHQHLHHAQARKHTHGHARDATDNANHNNHGDDDDDSGDDNLAATKHSDIDTDHTDSQSSGDLISLDLREPVAVVEADFGGAPEFTSAGVANAASFVAGPVAPGGLVSIFGFALGPEMPLSPPGFSSATGLLETELGGVEVEFDGIKAPLVFVSKNQLNLQAPYELAGRNSTNMVITRDGLSSATVLVPVAEAAPGLFVISETGGAILNQDSTLNTPANPAPRGGAVVVFGTGQGLVTSPVPTGGPALADPLSGRNGVTATVGGNPAQVLFAGLAPGSS